MNSIDLLDPRIEELRAAGCPIIEEDGCVYLGHRSIKGVPVIYLESIPEPERQAKMKVFLDWAAPVAMAIYLNRHIVNK